MCRSTSEISLWVWIDFFPNSWITLTVGLACVCTYVYIPEEEALFGSHRSLHPPLHPPHDHALHSHMHSVPLVSTESDQTLCSFWSSYMFYPHNPVYTRCFPQFYLLVSHYTDTHLYVFSLALALLLTINIEHLFLTNKVRKWSPESTVARVCHGVRLHYDKLGTIHYDKLGTMHGVRLHSGMTS